MHNIVKGALSNVIGNQNFDIVIFMNNANGSWSGANAAILKSIFSESYRKESASPQKQNLLLGTFEIPVCERAAKNLFLNVRTRLMDSNLSKRCEVDVLEHALRSLVGAWINKRILIIPFEKTNIKKLKAFSDRKLAGNKVSIFLR